MNGPNNSRPLSRRMLAAYALPAIPLAALGIPVHVYLPTVYADTLGLGLAAVGTALLLSRGVDMVLDPLIGVLCDRGNNRRKLWTALAVPLMAVSGWCLFLPPDGVQAEGVGVIWLTVWSALFYLGMTVMLVAYQAWGTDLTADYSGRTRVAAWREGAALTGMITVLALPTALAIAPENTLRVLFPPAIVALAAAVALTLWRVPEPPHTPPSGAQSASGLWSVVRANQPFRRLLAAQALNALANALPATLFLLFVGDALGRPALSGPLLLAYLLAAVVSVPVWLACARRWGKHRVWTVSLLLTAAAFLPTLVLDTGDWVAFAVVCVLTGFGLGADLCLPAAMLSDVTDEHAARAGDGHAGLYVALWSLTAKLALSVAVGVAFPLLDLSGFTPGSGQAPVTLALLYAAVPVVLKAGAAALIFSFPLDRARHDALRARIETPLTESRS